MPQGGGDGECCCRCAPLLLCGAFKVGALQQLQLSARPKEGQVLARGQGIEVAVPLGRLPAAGFVRGRNSDAKACMDACLGGCSSRGVPQVPPSQAGYQRREA